MPEDIVVLTRIATTNDSPHPMHANCHWASSLAVVVLNFMSYTVIDAQRLREMVS